MYICIHIIIINNNNNPLKSNTVICSDIKWATVRYSSMKGGVGRERGIPEQCTTPQLLRPLDDWTAIPSQ